MSDLVLKPDLGGQPNPKKIFGKSLTTISIQLQLKVPREKRYDSSPGEFKQHNLAVDLIKWANGWV